MSGVLLVRRDHLRPLRCVRRLLPSRPLALHPRGVLRLLQGPPSGVSSPSGVDCCPRLAAYSTSALDPWFSARGSRSSVSARGLLHPGSWLLGSRLTAPGSPSVPGDPGVLSQLSLLATGEGPSCTQQHPHLILPIQSEGRLLAVLAPRDGSPRFHIQPEKLCIATWCVATWWVVVTSSSSSGSSSDCSSNYTVVCD